MPWHNFRKVANSLMLFKLVTGLIAFFTIGLCAAAIGFIAVILHKNQAGFGVAGIFAIIIFAFITSIVGITFAVFFKFTNDFVIPIMYLDGCSCRQGWSKFLELLLSRKGAFALYILFQIVIAIAISMILMALVFGTCCCAGLIMMIPYIGTVLILPILVFKQAYVLYYLAQFGKSFDVFAASEDPVPDTIDLQGELMEDQ